MLKRCVTRRIIPTLYHVLYNTNRFNLPVCGGGQRVSDASAVQSMRGREASVPGRG